MNHFSLRFNTYYRLGLFEYLFLFVVLFVGFYFGMSTYALENINEGLYGEIPREMLQLKNYVIPHLNFVPYIEKPPLFYWLIALSYKLFGVSEWSARVVPATAASLLCLSLVYFGNYIRRNREGWLAGIILATSVGFVIVGRVLIFDMVLTLFFSLSLLCFYMWYQKLEVSYLRLFYAFLGLAFLTKGMLALFLIPAIVLIFMFLEGTRAKKMRQCIDLPGIALFLLIVIPWHYFAMRQEPGFIWDYFINEQVFRFLDKRIPHDYHTGPLYFYLPKLFLYLFPWSLLSFFLFKPVKSVEKSLYRFLWTWFVITLLFFSISQAKGDYYMIVGTPPLAFLLAFKINEIFQKKQSKTFIYFFALLALFECTALGLVHAATASYQWTQNLPEFFKLDPSFSQALSILFMSTVAFSVFGLMLCALYKRKHLLQFAFIIGLIFPLIIFFVIDKQKVQPKHSEFSLATYILQHDHDRPVYLYQEYEDISSILFYLKKRLFIIDSHSRDLYYGSNSLQAKGWFLSLRDFIENNKVSNYVLVPKNKFLEFIHAAQPVQYCIVAQSSGTVLLSNKMEDCENN